MTQESKFPTDLACHFNKFSEFLHELNQSLSIIQSYVSGCCERLENNTLNDVQLAQALGQIKKHTDVLADKIRCLSST